MYPVLYSFRRCPYAIRARLAVAKGQVPVLLREVLLREKPDAFLNASPSATVPCLVVGDRVIDESLDIMRWALNQNDPEGWLDMPYDGWDLIKTCDGPFKAALDRTKYATRYPQADPEEERALAMGYLDDLDQKLDGWLFGKPTIADFAILPFVRQFAFVDKPRFDQEAGAKLRSWLEEFLLSELFASVMPKFAPWQQGGAEPLFPGH